MDAAVVAKFVIDAGPAGVTADAVEKAFASVSRSTVNRRLAGLLATGLVRTQGRGRMTRYLATGPFAPDSIRAYLTIDWQSRPTAPFREDLLAATPLMDDGKATRLQSLNARARTLDRKFLANFLIDFSWGSSVLEGSTYSSLDTEALIEYGQKNPDKPTEDAALALNHKSAIEFLWSHRNLSTSVICELQSRLTDRHGLKEIEDSDHFLPDAQRGRPRDTEDLNINRSAYIPPFRPGTGYIATAFEKLVAVANPLTPVQSAFYLMTRIPYLQVFANGNKRTARLAANIPLLAAGLLPISFVDINKADYIQAMAAFYELGNLQLMEKMVIEGYVQSIVRGSELTPAERVVQVDSQQLKADLVAYVQSGKFPKGLAKTFIKTPLPIKAGV
jgi:Fic family protein